MDCSETCCSSSVSRSRSSPWPTAWNAPPLVGFLLAGVVVGPHGLGLIDSPEEIGTLSELGVALLLFAVGLELSLSHVRQWARSVFVGGSFQVAGTLGTVTVLALTAGIPTRQALFYGALAAMSSTAIVTKAYADRAELDTPHGRSVISILLFQDLCVLPLMLLVPILAGLGGSQVATAGGDLARGLLTMTVLVVGGRLLVRWTLDRVVLFRDRELFTLCVGFFGLGAAVVTSSVCFSIAIGAFIAGMIISESEYGLQALSDVLPFRSLFSGIFFTSIGMLLDIPIVMDQVLVLSALAALLFVLKVASVFTSVLALDGMFTTAVISGLSLAQIGEFSFLLAAVGLPLGLFRDGDYQLFLSAAVLSMMATPFLIHLARPFAEHLAGRLGRADRFHGPPDADGAETLRDHTVIVGYVSLAGMSHAYSRPPVSPLSYANRTLSWCSRHGMMALRWSLAMAPATRCSTTFGFARPGPSFSLFPPQPKSGGGWPWPAISILRYGSWCGPGTSARLTSSGPWRRTTSWSRNSRHPSSSS